MIPFELDREMNFLIGTPLAERWYNPLTRANRVELDWILEHVNLEPGRQVIDGGCHHGYYSVALGWRGALVYSVDLHKKNLDMMIANCAINGIKMNWGHAAIANVRGKVRVMDTQLGTLHAEGTSEIDAVTLMDICPEANVVKMDIEGAEFLVLPEAIDKMPNVDTWIVEIHPWWYDVSGKKDLFTPFSEKGFDLFWIDRSDEHPKVERIEGEIVLKMQSTLIAIKD